MKKWYYTRDGQQEGPISESELKALVASGRLADTSLAWAEGMTDWQAISSIPELAPTPSGVPGSMADITSSGRDEATVTSPQSPGQDPANPYSAPVSDMSQNPIDSSGMIGLEEIIPGSEPLNIGACISRAFELTKRHFGMLLVIGIIMMAISVGASMVMGFVDGLLDWGQAAMLPDVTGNEDIDDALNELASQGSFLNQIVCGIVDTFLGLGIVRIGLNVVSGKPFEIAMLFSQGGKTLRAFLGEILFGLMVGVGLILLIIPGIYLALRYGQYKNAIVDKDMGLFDAFSYSARITAGNKMPLAGLFILCFLIVIAGAIALLVGLLFAVPLVTLAPIIAYRWMQYGSNSVQER